MNAFRKTTQILAPGRWTPRPPGEYDPFPTHPVGGGTIRLGFDALAEGLPTRGVVACDGFAGVLWEDFRRRLEAALDRRGLKAEWRPTANALKPEAAIDELIRPFLGGEDPIFGRRFDGTLAAFFDEARWEGLGRPGAAPLTIVYGCGAALADPAAFLVYVDLPKNELQFRARAGVPTNLGTMRAEAPKPAYKRSYFVDWPVLNAHKKRLADRVDLVVDGQRPDEPAVMSGSDLRAALADRAVHWFRVRPWFEPGPWGGQWCRRHIPGLPPAPNYAWSFELIVPENGITFRDGDRLLEVSFDWLMYRHGPEVLGACAEWFGDEFPVRFDFLDTVEGGNLSVQVHPSPEYIRGHFGERFTQDETYYILDAEPGATVNLGFRSGVRPDEFREALERSYREATPLDAERWVQSHPARRGDLFLIPHGTIHGAGIGNLVLEISATPYIFTFKLYDWLRPDLDGRPRPLNIERGMANLDFGREGERVAAELISRPEVIEEGDGWTIERLPTHPDHFYEVFRYRFREGLRGRTEGSFHALNLVEGSRVELETDGGQRQAFNFAETFVVPAAAGGYRLRNSGGGDAVVVGARMKKEWPAWMRDAGR